MTVSKRIRKYKLSLSYERPFDPTEGKQTKLKIFFELTDSAGNIRMVSEDQSMRMFQGDSVEELLYTVDEFIKLRETMTGFEDDMLHDEFKKVLEHDHRETFIQLMADNNYARDRDGFDQAINHLIEDIGRDPHGKESMIAAIMQGELRKPKLVDVIDHHKRYMWLIKCVDRLSTSNAFFLTEEEIKNYYEYTYPHEWVLEYQMARPETETIVQMRDYMVLKQQKVNLKEKEKENPTIAATPGIERKVVVEAVGKEEADAEADAEKAKEATKLIGKERNTKPAVQNHAAPCTKIVTTPGVIVVRTQTAQTTDPIPEEVEAVVTVAVEAVDAVAVVEDTTMTAGTITKVTVTNPSHEETSTTTIEWNNETIIPSRRQGE